MDQPEGSGRPRTHPGAPPARLGGSRWAPPPRPAAPPHGRVLLHVLAQALLEVVTTGPVGTHPLVGHTQSDSTLLFTPDASLPDAFYYQSTVFEWNNAADPSVNRILLRSPAGVARLEFDNISSYVKAANDSVLQVIAPAQPAGTQSPQLAGGAPRRARVLLTLNAASENFVGETPYAYHAEPEVTLVLPAGGAGWRRPPSCPV